VATHPAPWQSRGIGNFISIIERRGGGGTIMESSPIISALNCENCSELLQGKPRFNICTISIRKEEKKIDATFFPTVKTCPGTTV
jgi:hypothetical protein